MKDSGDAKDETEKQKRTAAGSIQHFPGPGNEVPALRDALHRVRTDEDHVPRDAPARAGGGAVKWTETKEQAP